ncbi:MAG: efflux RND transporter periplasmic adaptor subunit [Bacteroidales bacterium]|nr:efflux RND transporter periplasmic adaptor subunit [Bacteroidales bacterium]
MKKVLFILATVLVILGCRKQGAEEEAPASDFETMTVSKQDITLEQSYPAQIEGRQSINIIPKVEGYLRQICVKEGQRVKKGQVLFIIDQASYQAEVKAAEANVAVAKAGVETAQLSYDSRKILCQKNVVSDYDLRTATANLSMAKAQAQQALAQLQLARTNLSYTVLRSPSDGVVGSLPFRTGDFVGPSTQGGLTTVADAHEMYVYFSLTERDAMSRIAKHGSLDKAVAAFAPVILLTANGDTCAVKGRVESISGVVDSNTGSVSARAIFPNADGLLLSGSTGIIVASNEMKQVIVIPQSATYEIQDKTYAWRLVHGKAKSKMITVLPTSDGNNYVVTSGLSVGDVIVAKGAGYVKEGQEICEE